MSESEFFKILCKHHIGQKGAPLKNDQYYSIWLDGSHKHAIKFSSLGFIKLKYSRQRLIWTRIIWVSVEFELFARSRFCMFHYFIPKFIRIIWSSDDLNFSGPEHFKLSVGYCSLLYNLLINVLNSYIILYFVMFMSPMHKRTTNPNHNNPNHNKLNTLIYIRNTHGYATAWVNIYLKT